MSQLTVRSAVVIARTVKALRTNPNYLAAKSDADLALMVRASAVSLARLSRDGVAPDVRLPAAVLTAKCWALFKAAKAEQRRRGEAQAADDVLASLRERLVLALDALAEREAIGADAWEERADVAYFRARLAQVAPYYPDPCFYCGGAVKVGAQCDC